MLAFFCFLLPRAFLQCAVNVVRNELIHLLVVLSEGLGVVQPVFIAEAESLGQVHESGVEMLAKVDRVFLFPTHDCAHCELAVDRFAEEKLAGAVDCQAEEEGLDVRLCCPAVGLNWHHLQHILHVPLFQVEVGDLVTGEVGPEKSSAMLPLLSVLNELDASQLGIVSCSQRVLQCHLPA